MWHNSNIFLFVTFATYMLGEAQKHEFQAETRQLLDIVAKTLYSEKEVWNNIRSGYTLKLLYIGQATLLWLLL